MLSVLLVDDHPLVRQGLRAVLSLEPDLAIVGETGGIEGAWSLIQTQRPDLILLDIRLGQENGLTILDRCQNEHLACKFLVLTSSTTASDFESARALGASGYVLKDALPEELVFAIHLIGQGRKYYDPKILDQWLETQRHPDLMVDSLSEREWEVLSALGEGLSNREIAEKLYISIFTVKKHVSQILAKLSLADRTQAALYALSRQTGTGEDVASKH